MLSTGLMTVMQQETIGIHFIAIFGKWQTNILCPPARNTRILTLVEYI